jgi:hypothetical protein
MQWVVILDMEQKSPTNASSAASYTRDPPIANVSKRIVTRLSQRRQLNPHWICNRMQFGRINYTTGSTHQRQMGKVVGRFNGNVPFALLACSSASPKMYPCVCFPRSRARRLCPIHVRMTWHTICWYLYTFSYEDIYNIVPPLEKL